MTQRLTSHQLAAVLISVVILSALFAGCGPNKKTNAQEGATPDLGATRAALATEIVATITAQALIAFDATETPFSTPTEPPPPSPTVSVKLEPQATMTPNPTSTSTPTTVPTAIPAPPPMPECTVATEMLNVRAGPSTSHPVLDVVKRGDVLPVIGRTLDGTWLQVRLPSNEVGWVAAYLVELDEHGQTVQVADTIPTPPPAPARPASGPKTLEVSFLNPHYECQQKEWGSEEPFWGYRSFQVDMYIKNNGSEPVTPPWRPTRWIITDGTNDYINDMIWQWVDPRTGFYEQPVIHPGESAGWTFLAFPLDRNQWLKAVEFTWKGQTYRQTFDLGPFGNAYNYKDCGEPKPHTFRPTPTPRP